jgi:hypothetical protein
LRGLAREQIIGRPAFAARADPNSQSTDVHEVGNPNSRANTMKTPASRPKPTTARSPTMPVKGTQALDLYFAQIDSNLRNLKDQFSLLPSQLTEIKDLLHELGRRR